MNPKIVRAKDGTYLLFYTGDTFNSTTPPPEHSLPMDIQATQRVGMAYSSDITGPFTRVPHPVLDVRLGGLEGCKKMVKVDVQLNPFLSFVLLLFLPIFVSHSNSPSSFAQSLLRSASGTGTSGSYQTRPSQCARTVAS